VQAALGSGAATVEAEDDEADRAARLPDPDTASDGEASDSEPAQAGAKRKHGGAWPATWRR
jgi:hypothetical protein